MLIMIDAAMYLAALNRIFSDFKINSTMIWKKKGELLSNQELELKGTVKITRNGLHFWLLFQHVFTA